MKKDKYLTGGDVSGMLFQSTLGSILSPINTLTGGALDPLQQSLNKKIGDITNQNPELLKAAQQANQTQTQLTGLGVDGLKMMAGFQDGGSVTNMLMTAYKNGGKLDYPTLEAIGVTKRQANKAYKDFLTKYETGGSLMPFNPDHLEKESENLVQYDGPDHPQGGIKTPSGEFNLQETVLKAGKVSDTPYAFSDINVLDKSTAEQLGLDSKHVGKTMAEISKSIEKKYEVKFNDDDTKVKTKQLMSEDLYSRLMEANEVALQKAKAKQAWDSKPNYGAMSQDEFNDYMCGGKVKEYQGGSFVFNPGTIDLERGDYLDRVTNMTKLEKMALAQTDPEAYAWATNYNRAAPKENTVEEDWVTANYPEEEALSGLQYNQTVPKGFKPYDYSKLKFGDTWEVPGGYNVYRSKENLKNFVGDPEEMVYEEFTQLGDANTLRQVKMGETAMYKQHKNTPNPFGTTISDDTRLRQLSFAANPNNRKVDNFSFNDVSTEQNPQYTKEAIASKVDPTLTQLNFGQQTSTAQGPTVSNLPQTTKRQPIPVVNTGNPSTIANLKLPTQLDVIEPEYIETGTTPQDLAAFTRERKSVWDEYNKRSGKIQPMGNQRTTINSPTIPDIGNAQRIPVDMKQGLNLPNVDFSNQEKIGLGLKGLAQLGEVASTLGKKQDVAVQRNPYANQVSQLMRDRYVDMTPIQDQIASSARSAYENLASTNSQVVNAALGQGISNQQMAQMSQAKLQAQQLNNGYTSDLAQTLNNLGQQDVAAKNYQENLQAQTDANVNNVRREALGNIGNDLGNYFIAKDVVKAKTAEERSAMEMKLTVELLKIPTESMRKEAIQTWNKYIVSMGGEPLDADGLVAKTQNQ